MAGRTLAQWLDHQLALHPKGIALGLERVRAVADALSPGRAGRVVVAVAGTNGKGSSVAMLESIARAAGLRTAAYTSPHLLRYTERLRLDGAELPDADWCAAFDAVEAARGDVPLTFFEFGTLAAWWLSARAAPDLALFEVGLGGRLDAVNALDADAALITSIGIDHVDWLGSDRDSIGREKAGIARAGRVAVVADPDPPRGLLDALAALGADVRCRGVAFDGVRTAPDGWSFRADARAFDLPMPALQAPCQIDNAAGVVALLDALRERLPVAPHALAEGLRTVRLAGRMQPFGDGRVEQIADVAHNPDSAAQLAGWLDAHPVPGAVIGVFSALGDKDIPAMLAPLRGRLQALHLAGLEGTPRGLAVDALAARVATVDGLPPARAHAGVPAALAAARAQARPGDRIVVFGSFHTCAEALAVDAG